MNSHNNGNDSVIDSCLGTSRQCALYAFVLTATTFIFVASMIVTVYLTHVDNIDVAVVVLIVGSCLLYLFCFLSNMYSIYHMRPSNMPSGNDDNSNRSSPITAASSQSISTNPRPPDIVRVSRSGIRFRNTPPPPPSEIQMTEMSRMLLPGSSRTTESSAREAEIAEEARKLIQKLYEEVKRTGWLSEQSSVDEQSRHQMVPTSKIPATLQETTSPKVFHQNLALQKQQSIVENSPSRGIPDNFRTNQVIQQEVGSSSLPTQLDAGRLINGSVVPLQSSPRIPGRPIDDLGRNQGVKQKFTPNSFPCQSDLRKITIDSDGCAVTSPQLSDRREDFVKAAHKRKLSQSREAQTRPKTIGSITPMAAVNSYSQNNVYEEIEDMGSIHSANSSQASNHPVDYYYTQNECNDPSKQTSVKSAACEPSKARKVATPNLKERRQLSLLSTRKFYQLGQSPDTVLDAIATCFDLTPNEWMAAWQLSQKGVPPDERARILGVRLQEDCLELN